MCPNIEKPVITIGLPVYNGEKTIKKTLNSIIEQTFTDFQVIISDNNSSDNTERICQEFSKKNSKITYIRQNENKGPLYNFKFVLNSANSKYFVWLAADDWWEPTFLEKNVSVLDSNKKFVASVSKINYYDVDRKNIKWKEAKSLKFKIKRYYGYDEYFDSRKYQDRVSFYLRLNRAENLYGLFRTPILKKCVKKCWEKESTAFDLKILLFIQRFGEINLLEEILFHRSGKGISTKSSSQSYLTEYNKLGLLGKIFPRISFSWWILRNLGPAILLKNLDYISFINGAATKYQIKHFFKKNHN